MSEKRQDQSQIQRDQRGDLNEPQLRAILQGSAETIVEKAQSLASELID